MPALKPFKNPEKPFVFIFSPNFFPARVVPWLAILSESDSAKPDSKKVNPDSKKVNLDSKKVNPTLQGP